MDGGNPTPVVLGVKIFSDVPGQVVGCSFYKAPANLGVHVVSLWDTTGKLLASRAASGETASGKQSVLFSSPVAIVAKQVVICGYSSPQGHYSATTLTFAAQTDAVPLHISPSGGLYSYGAPSTTMPATATTSNFWADVLFVPSGSSTTWISGVTASQIGSGATVAWNTAAKSDSQVEYGATNAYGTTTPLAATAVTAHTVALSGLVAGTTYHYRARSRDSDAVLAIGVDHTLTTSAAVMVAITPATASIASGAALQLMALVSNSSNAGVAWTATAGTVTSSGMFTAPSVSSATSVTVTATSLADATKTSSATLMVAATISALAVTPASLSFSGQAGAVIPPSSVSVTNTGSGSLAFTGASDQPWLLLSPGSGNAPSSLQISTSLTGMKAGAYTGHITLTAGGIAKAVTVLLTLTAPATHSVTLAWKAASTEVVKYNMYRSTISGGYYSVVASALIAPAFSDSSVLAATTYYYVVTAVDSTGRESGHSNQIQAVVP